MRAFSNAGKPVFRKDTEVNVEDLHLPSLRLCKVCNALPPNVLSLERGYDHYASIRLLRDSAGSHNYCHLCQMFWESIATKQRFNLTGDPMLLENWPIRIHDIRGQTWRGYDALELRSGDFSSASVNWATAPTWHTPGTAGSTYPVCSRLYLHPGDKSNALTYTSCALDVQSAISLNQIKTWSDNCTEYHNHPHRTSILPTRVIDVTSSTLRLHVKGGEAAYTALSYCWGTSKATTTTSANLEQHIDQGFSLPELPRTIQDAVTVTRALGIQYLWVDALCIIQGSDEAAQRDWDIESSRMAEVYGGASITLIAASSSDCNDGIFQSRQLINTSKVATDGFMHRQIWSAHRKVDTKFGLTTQYNVRAWTLQEMVLSSRSIFFTQNMTFWKCPAGIVGEDCKAARFSAIRSMTAELALEDWHAVVQEYSRRKLTNPDDKLTALSGLAFQYHERHKHHYVAGLWEESLIRNMLWRTELSGVPASFPTTWRAPSWSWASTNENIDFDLAPTKITASEYQAQITPVVELNSLCSYGRLKSASLTVKAKWLPVKRWRVNAFHSAGDAVTNSVTVRAYIDTKSRWEDSFDVEDDCWLLFLTPMHGLVITLTTKPTEYVRIGMFIVPKKARSDFFDTLADVYITLI